jgi:hypothetical protein
MLWTCVLRPTEVDPQSPPAPLCPVQTPNVPQTCRVWKRVALEVEAGATMFACQFGLVGSRAIVRPLELPKGRSCIWKYNRDKMWQCKQKIKRAKKGTWKISIDQSADKPTPTKIRTTYLHNAEHFDGAMAAILPRWALYACSCGLDLAARMLFGGFLGPLPPPPSLPTPQRTPVFLA